MALLVDDGNNRNSGRQDHEVRDIREAGKWRLSHIIKCHRKCLWRPLNCSEYDADGSEKLEPQTNSSLLVPDEGFVEIVLGLSTKEQGGAHAPPDSISSSASRHG